ncbi:methyl-accepting chemotaxis protein [Aquabacterium sp. J223]|uniref:methyl-accepting chemotaxis protein n=1 Tax=Aquabacterium sp. J223 TaxID=2898431 RepID=UPI0021ADD4A2|nr:methyl-accepting chemotaxis protein [Aquabacterium sp. J223]UUX95823.1 methyl-accepting chemotaxis protein [Aquabacterium sp. J223]
MPLLQSMKAGLMLAVAFNLVALLGVTALAAAHAEAAGRALVLTAGGGASLACLAVGLWAARRAAAPLARLLRSVQRIAEGDLATTVTPEGPAEARQLMAAVQALAERLAGIVGAVRAGTTTVASTSSTLSRDNAALAARTDSQAESLQRTTHAVEQLTRTVGRNADNAAEADALVGRAANEAGDGGRVVGEVVATMGSIRDGSRRIAEIIGVIDGIAFQTNILALNAAVEAARAGEQGRGFAVVAGEVRTLAQRSATAAKEIKVLINDSVDRVEAGAALADQAGRAMQSIVASVQSAASRVREISGASREQSEGIQSVHQAIAGLDAMVRETGAVVREAGVAAQTLNQQARSLLGSVQGFDLGTRDQGSADEAQALVRQALAFAQREGVDALEADINRRDQGRFRDRDLYLFTVGVDDAVFRSHGSNARLLGTGPDTRDTAGKPFVREIAQLARTRGSGWVDYRFAHPVTNEDLAKTSYVERCGDVAVCCGVYKKG